ncbi:MAG: BspA family leucine-rich repeat surface protein [Bacilli bacterium]|nr:BspA family leucine-rich repeat surface protein [Bacilli bacterium]
MIKYFKNKFKRGFTLVELLGVIAILGVLIVIAVTNVSHKIKVSKKNAFIDKVYQYMKATDYENLIVDDIDDDTDYDEERIYRFPDDELEAVDEQPDGGYIIHENGKVAVSIWSDTLKSCAKKGFDDAKITIDTTITKKSKCITVPGETEIDEDILTSNQYQVVFYSNYYHGPQATIQVIDFGVYTPLNANTFTRDGYVFYRWTTKPNGTGTRYNDGDEIRQWNSASAEKTIRLYAQWNETSTTLLSGSDLNKKLKQIANPNSTVSGNTFNDNNIKTFAKSDTPPDSSIMDAAHTISVSGTEYPAYAWLDSSGNMKWWCQTSNVSFNQNMGHMFQNMKGLTTVDLSGINSGSLRELTEFFVNDTSLTTINFGSIDTSGVTMFTNMFSGCSSITSLDLRNIDTSSAQSMDGMFKGCTSLSNLNVSNWHVEKVQNMIGMFQSCTSLTTLDLSSFETLELQKSGSMFSGCTNLRTLLLPNFNTAKATNIYAMFNGCSNLTTLDLRTFTAEKLTTANNVFYGCSNLTSIDLRNFRPTQTMNIANMFSGCGSLVTVTVPADFDETKLSTQNGVFTNAKKIVGGANTHYDSSHTNTEYARVDNPSANKPGYFTAYSG